MRDTPASGFDVVAAARQVAYPAALADWLQVAGILVFAVIGGVFVAAALAAKRDVDGA